MNMLSDEVMLDRKSLGEQAKLYKGSNPKNYEGKILYEFFPLDHKLIVYRNTILFPISIYQTYLSWKTTKPKNFNVFCLDIGTIRSD